MIRTLLKSVREYKLTSVLCPIFMAGEAIMEIIIPWRMAVIIEQFENLSKNNIPIDLNVVVFNAVLMIFLSLFALFCGVMGGIYGSKASCGFATNLRKDMYDNIQNYSFENIDKYSTASLITRITTDVTNVQNSYQMCIRMLVRAPALFISAIIMTCLLEPKMAGIFVAAAVVLGLVLSFGMFKVTPYFRTMFKKYDKLNSVVQEDLTAIRVVKSYVREDREIEKMQKATAEVYEYSVKAEKILNYLMPAVTLTLFTSNILIITLGSMMSLNWIDGAVGPSDLQMLINYSFQILSGVMMVAMCINFIALSKGSMERICEVLGEKTTIPVPEHPVYEVKDGSIDFEHVDFAYSAKQDKIVLSDINLHISSGETVGIIGATGSGKSSLVSLIPRLYDAVNGHVKVGGVDVKDYDLETLRNKVAMVLQKNVLFSGTVAENLRWGNENASDEELRFAARQACAEEFVDALPGGFNYDLGQGGVNVSGGQKQRLCIARALLKKPDVIIFDDSTSAVDTKTDAQIRSSLGKYAPQTTKIIIAQRIASVQEADRIIVMDEGHIAGIGKHDELLKSNEIYREVYESQMKGGEDNE